MTIERVGDITCALGEGPVWDPVDGVLYFVDSLAPAIFRHDPASGATVRRDPPGSSIGSLALREQGAMVIAMDSGFHAFDFETGACQAIAEPEADLANCRFNDGKVDRQGRFIAGSLNKDFANAVCGLHRLDDDHSVERIAGGISCANGPCWSPDGSTFYFVHGGDDTIQAYDYDQATGRLSNRRLFVDCASLGAGPDGATVDAEGFVWSAQFGIHQVARFAPDGSLDRMVEVPPKMVTSVMFGGVDLDVLYVTSASGALSGYSDDSVHAGGTFAILGLGVTGLAEPRFKG
ncbi:MAG: SMP-30/gluconolactonase/LRE family protein [Alphaproteobacteria bacterium]